MILHRASDEYLEVELELVPDKLLLLRLLNELKITSPIDSCTVFVSFTRDPLTPEVCNSKSQAGRALDAEASNRGQCEFFG